MFPGRVFTKAVVSLNIPGSGLFANFVKRLKNGSIFSSRVEGQGFYVEGHFFIETKNK